MPAWPTVRVAEHLAGAGHDVVRGPAGLLVDDREAVRHRLCVVFLVVAEGVVARLVEWGELAEDLVDPLTRAHACVGLERSIGVLFRRACRPIAAWIATRASPRASSTSSSFASPRRLSNQTTARRRSGSTSTEVMATSSSRSSSRRSISSAAISRTSSFTLNVRGYCRVGCARGRLGFLTRATSSRCSAPRPRGATRRTAPPRRSRRSHGAGCWRRPRNRGRRAATGPGVRPRPPRRANRRRAPSTMLFTTLRFIFSDRASLRCRSTVRVSTCTARLPWLSCGGSRAPRTSR